MGHVDGRLEGQRQVLRKLRSEVGGQTVAVVVTGVGPVDGVLVGVVGTQVVLGLLVTAADGEVVHLAEGVVLHDGVIPGELLVTGIVVAIVGDQLFGVTRGIALLVTAHFVVHLHPGRDVGLLGESGRDAEGERGRVVDGRSADLALLRGHEDDTVLGAQTVDGCGSVLEDGDALDVLGVEFGEGGGGAVVVLRPAPVLTLAGAAGDTVDDHERGAVATKAEGIVEPADCTGFLTDHKARDLTLEGGGQVGLLGRGDVLGLDVGDGRGQGRFLLRTVTDHDGLFQFGSFLLKRDVHRGGSDFDLQGLISDGGYGQVCTHRHGEGVITVEIRGGAVRGARLHDGRTDDRLLVGIENGTLHRNRVLGKQRRGAERESAEHQTEPLEQIVGFHHNKDG